MRYRNVREALRAVDPDLKIIPGRVRYSKRKHDNNDWEACGGNLCPQCGHECVRLKQITPGKWACPQCYINYAEKFSKTEASLGALVNSKDPGLARRARKYLMKRMPV